MREWRRQSHVKWYCRYHVVIVPKYRQKAIFGKLRKDIGRILRELCEQFEIELIEGHAMPDHMHLCLSIPPKYSVATAVGRLKGKSAIRIHREYLGRKRNFTGFHFWSKDLRKQLADFERSIEPMRDTTLIGQLICMVLRCKSDPKGYL
jgi:putative transposase